ncbi:MAG: zinc-dependent metalloprotease [Pseudomonadota bacterium]
MIRALCCTLLLLAVSPLYAAEEAAKQAADPAPSHRELLASGEHSTGFFDLVRTSDGRVLLNVPADRGEFLLQLWLARGVGSNDLGLDRGLPDRTRLVTFRRVGNQVLLIERNTRYRATADRPAERQAVQEAFAESVLWGFTVKAASERHYLIDYTDFLLADSLGIAEQLKTLEQGSFKVERTRSAPYLPRTRTFPRNTELEGTVTFTGAVTGDALASVAPDQAAFSVHLHHSLIALPEPGFEPRAFHPMSGYFAFSYADYSAPIDADITQRFIRRHRLPAGGRITYYLDPGVPEPIRSALLDGARWWADAFAAAGHPNGFAIELLPADADPMDVRYNVIQWVHRRTRGWSYGLSVIDPRTGEIIKGKVTLGSLRVRQDVLIAQGLLSPYKAGLDETQAGAAVREMALARIRQLAAHEIGHTLGLAHNFAASTQGRRSVMDYPHPLLKLRDGGVDLSDAYAVGIGTWDKQAIRYGYGIAENETEFLAAQLQRVQTEGLAYLSDPDARPAGSAHPTAHLWDSGADPVAALADTLAVRAVALERLGADSLRTGTPYSELSDLLVPIYYLHRYQSEAVAKLIGGLRYRYAVKGDGAPAASTPVAATVQNQALSALLLAIDAERLTPPEPLLQLTLPKAYGYALDRENTPTLVAPLFDPVTAAEAAAEHILALLLHPARLARLQQQHARDTALPAVDAVLESLLDRTVLARRPAGLAGAIHGRIETLAVEHLLVIAYGGGHDSASAALAAQRLAGLAKTLRRAREPERAQLAHMIERASRDGVFTRRSSVPALPPGSPI